jgi:hypothetical protein
VVTYYRYQPASTLINPEGDGSGGNETDLRSEGVRSESWPAFRIFRLRTLVVLLRLSRQIPRRLSLEDEGTTIFLNVGNHLPNDTASYSSRFTKWHVFDINQRVNFSWITFDRNIFRYHKYVAYWDQIRVETSGHVRYKVFSLKWSVKRCRILAQLSYIKYDKNSSSGSGVGRPTFRQTDRDTTDANNVKFCNFLNWKCAKK